MPAVPTYTACQIDALWPQQPFGHFCQAEACLRAQGSPQPHSCAIQNPLALAMDASSDHRSAATSPCLSELRSPVRDTQNPPPEPLNSIPESLIFTSSRAPLFSVLPQLSSLAMAASIPAGCRLNWCNATPLPPSFHLQQLLLTPKNPSILFLPHGSGHGTVPISS